MTSDTISAMPEGLRQFSGTLGLAVLALAIFLSVTHLFLAIFPWLSETDRNIFHFAGFALMCALLYPMWTGSQGGRSKTALYIDILIGLAVCAASLHLSFAENWIYERGVRLVTADWIAGIVVILGAIELTRRAAGLVIPVLIVLSLTYVSFWGAWIGGVI